MYTITVEIDYEGQVSVEKNGRTVAILDGKNWTDLQNQVLSQQEQTVLNRLLSVVEEMK